MTITDTPTRHEPASTQPTIRDSPPTTCSRSSASVRARADADNTYLHDDLAVLRDMGYLAAAVPVEFGGWGLNLGEFAELQRRLATYAPATALSMTMHTYWIGIAAELERFGDTSCRWLFDEAVAGRIVAAGHAEAGNDAPVVMSTTLAIAGRRRLPVQRSQDVRLERAGVVAARRPRHRPVRPRRPDDRPRLRRPRRRRRHGGARAGTRSACDRPRATTRCSTRCSCPMPVSPGSFPPASDDDLFLFTMNMWALPIMANVYLGIAERALELAIESATTKSSVAIPRGTYAHNPMVQHQIAEMYLELDPARALVDRLIADWVRRRRPRCDVGSEDRLGQVACGRSRQAGRRHRTRRRRWCVDGSWQRTRTPLPGRPSGRLPPGERRPHPRDGRQDAAGDRPDRPSLVRTGHVTRRANVIRSNAAVASWATAASSIPEPAWNASSNSARTRRAFAGGFAASEDGRRRRRTRRGRLPVPSPHRGSGRRSAPRRRRRAVRQPSASPSRTGSANRHAPTAAPATGTSQRQRRCCPSGRRARQATRRRCLR